MGSSSGYNTFLLKQKENSGSVTATFRDIGNLCWTKTVKQPVFKIHCGVRFVKARTQHLQMWNSGFMMLDWTVVQKRFFVVGFKLRLFCWTYVGAAVWNLATGWDGTLVFKFGGCSGWKSDSGKHLKSMHIWDSANLKLMRTHIPRSVAHKVTVQPPVEQFADMLEALFHGTPIESQQPDDLNETPWTMAELEVAIAKLNCKKCADGAGLVAELLKNAPEEILKVLLALFNEILSLGAVPVEWSKTLFIMLSKKPGAVQPTDFRPIAIVRLLYKTFAYLILGRIEGPLDAHQPEEQHGFRSNYRVEEHLLPVTRPHYMVCRYGSSVWTCPKPLIACLGQRCGVPCKAMGCPHTWFGYCKPCMQIKLVKWSAIGIRAVLLIYMLA